MTTAFADIGVDPLLEQETRTPKQGVVDCDWTNPADIVDLKNWLWDNKDYKRRVEEQAIRNIAYAMGDQHRKLNRRTMTMEPDKERPRWEILLTYNNVLPRMLMRSSRLEAADVEWSGAAETDDDNDRVIARMQRKLAAHYYTHKFKMSEQLRRASMLAMMTKVSFFHLDWNPLSGSKRIVTPDQLAPVSQLTGMPDAAAGAAYFTQLFGPEALQTGRKVQWTGDAAIKLHNLFEIITWPFNAKCWDDVRVWMLTEMCTITEAARSVNLPVEQVKNLISPKKAEDEPFEDRMLTSWGTASQSDFGAGRVTKPSADDSATQMVYRHILWLDPRYDPEASPFGRTATCIEDVCPPESLKELPYRNPRVPIWVIQDQPIEGTLYGTCLVDQLRAGQDDINDAATQMANARRRAIHPTIFTFGGFKGPKKVFDNAPGKVIPLGSVNQMPKILERPDLPSDYERSMSLAVRFMDDIAGTADIDRGRTEDSGVRSGTAISSLQRRNDSRVAPHVKSRRSTSSEMCDFTIELLQEFAADDRIEQIIGENNRVELITWNREMIRPSTWGNGETRGAMVRSSGGIGMPTNPEDLFTTIEGLTQLGYLNPMEDKRLVLKSIGVGELSSAWDASRVDAGSEAAAIEMFRQGQVPPIPRDTSDFDERLDILGRWINGDEYLEVIRRNPMLGDAIEERKQALRQGKADREVEQTYLMASADLRMRNKYLARWMKEVAQGTADPLLVQAIFGQPILARGAAAAAPGGGQPQKKPGGGGGGAQKPPQQNAPAQKNGNEQLTRPRAVA